MAHAKWWRKRLASRTQENHCLFLELLCSGLVSSRNFSPGPFVFAYAHVLRIAPSWAEELFS